jgi:hypothetical protein
VRNLACQSGFPHSAATVGVHKHPRRHALPRSHLDETRRRIPRTPRVLSGSDTIPSLAVMAGSIAARKDDSPLDLVGGSC